MKSFRLALGLVAISAVTTCSAAHAAPATRTWVSGAGSDANLCTRTAPCATWTVAIANTAAGGEVDALDPGDFGPVTITGSITLDGGGGQVASILMPAANSSTGILIEAGSTAVVTIRNIRIQGALANIATEAGIADIGAGTVHIEHCVIAGVGGNGMYIAPQNQPAAGSQVFVEDTVVQDSGYNGIYILGQSSANVHVTVSSSRFTGNGLFGLYAAEYSRVTVRNSESSGNAFAGYQANARNGTTILSMIDSVATNNLDGGVIAGGGGGTSTVRIANMGLFNNVTGLITGANGSIVSFGNNNNSGSGTPTGSIPQD
jgi:hypothetical protein